MRSKIWRIASVVYVAAALLAAACAPAATPAPAATEAPAEPTEAPAAETVDLKLWQIPLSDAYSAWWESFIADYNGAHPEVNVTLETFPFDVFVEKRVGALATDTIGDVFWGPPDPFNQEQFAAGKIASLDGILDADRLLDFQRDACTFNGQLACMPLYFAPALFFYNKAQFVEAGIDPATWANPARPTWDEFIAANDALVAAGIPPIVLGNEDLYPGMLILHGLQHRLGGAQALKDAVTGENGGSFTADSFIAAGEEVQKMAAAGYFVEGYNAIGGERKYTIFTSGEGAMTFMGFWISSYIVDAPEGFEYGWFDFPSTDGPADSQATIQGGVESLWLASAYDHPEVAGDFLNAFLDADAQKNYMDEVQIIPPSKGTLPETVDADAPIVVKAGDFLAKEAQGSYAFVDYDVPSSVYDAMLANIQALYTGDMSSADYWASVEEAAAAAR